MSPEQVLLVQLARQLRQRRQQQQLTQKALAQRIRVSPNTIYLLEAGANTSLQTWLKVSSALGLVVAFEPRHARDIH